MDSCIGTGRAGRVGNGMIIMVMCGGTHSLPILLYLLVIFSGAFVYLRGVLFMLDCRGFTCSLGGLRKGERVGCWGLRVGEVEVVCACWIVASETGIDGWMVLFLWDFVCVGEVD